MHHRSAGLTRPRISGPRAAGPPSNARDNPVAGGRDGPWARGATRPASCRPLQFGPPCCRLAPPRWHPPAGGRQASGSKTAGIRGATPAVVARIEQEPRSLYNHIFFRIDVGFPGQVWSSQVREAKSRCQVKRAGRLLLECPAARRPSAGSTWHEAVGSKIKFLREGGAERWMAHEHGELGIGPGEPGTPAGVNIASPGITDS